MFKRVRYWSLNYYYLKLVSEEEQHSNVDRGWNGTRTSVLLNTSMQTDLKLQ